jgi:hypothetical protein
MQMRKNVHFQTFCKKVANIILRLIPNEIPKKVKKEAPYCLYSLHQCDNSVFLVNNILTYEGTPDLSIICTDREKGRYIVRDRLDCCKMKGSF